MYENTGKKLKDVVSTITGLMMFVSVIAGILVWIIFAGTSSGLLGFFLGVIVAVVGCVSAWLSNLVLATFAEIAIDVHKLAEQVDQPADDTAVVQDMPVASVERPAENGTGWVCASCGTKNAWRVYSCQSCGVTKAWSENHSK